MVVNVARRTFLKSAGAFSGMLFFEPMLALGDGFAPSEVWKQTVTNFVLRVLPNQTGQSINAVIMRSSVSQSPGARTFHDYYGPRLVIEAQLMPASTSDGRFFELDRVPLYDSHNPCRRIKELNRVEILTITDPRIVAIYDTIVSPCSERRPPQHGGEYNNFCRTASEYGVRPETVTREYTRNFTDGKKSYLGHGVSFPSNLDPQGKPRKALLLASEDI